ncbi:hypothetical protein [Sphingomonas mollis]|uniref:Uncharacterized protein n=1 Tax=Sphingomonas mollis TaxID=2795726 RepID=A0ABS0XTZ0_9SPHN|nr:hypothetical protein [Sphingomonas sp. BT553]MBJ6123509.1 hypothetical protein [Sphingomonas sp. BT553]
MLDFGKARFCAVFQVVPLISCSIFPTMMFEVLAGQWGTNLVWESYFGLGWCLSAFWSEDIMHDQFSTATGLIWGWPALMPLYVTAGWLWKRLSQIGRRVAAKALAVSVLFMVPAKAMPHFDELGIHLPDYSIHLTTSL